MIPSAFVLECLEHEVRMEEMVALHIRAEDYRTVQQTDNIIRLLSVCCTHSTTSASVASMLLIATTEIFLANRLDQSHALLFASLIKHLCKLATAAASSASVNKTWQAGGSVSIEVRVCALECLRQVETVHPAILLQMDPELKTRLLAAGFDKTELAVFQPKLLLLLAISAHQVLWNRDVAEAHLSLISLALDSLGLLSRWARCQALELLLAIQEQQQQYDVLASVDHLLGHHRVMESLGLVTSPICLHTLFRLAASNSSNSNTFAQLNALSLAVARNPLNAQQVQLFAMQLRRDFAAHFPTVLPTRFDSFELGVAILRENIARGECELASKQSWVVDDFWRLDDIAIARKAFDVYSALLAAGVGEEKIASNLVKRLIFPASQNRFLPLLRDFLTKHPNSLLLWEHIAAAFEYAECIADMFDLMQLALILHNGNGNSRIRRKVVAALYRFSNTMTLDAGEEMWPQVERVLEMCRELARIERSCGFSRRSPTLIALMRVVETLQLRHPYDVILQDECEQFLLLQALDYDPVVPVPELEELEDSVFIDFEDLVSLTRVDEAHLALEWKPSPAFQAYELLALEIRVDLEHTPSSCYDFAQSPIVACIPRFPQKCGGEQALLLPFSLPKSDLYFPVRIFFTATASSTTRAGVLLQGPMGSISIELADLFVSLKQAPPPAHFAPTTRLCICIENKRGEEVQAFVQRTFGPFCSSTRDNADVVTWRHAALLPPCFYVALNMEYCASTRRFTARVQTDVWIILPELDRLFQKLQVDYM